MPSRSALEENRTRSSAGSSRAEYEEQPTSTRLTKAIETAGFAIITHHALLQ
jgi:hypothetical protein